jgi:leader peptidase (prepilin peptidase)/N-methyltransferase
MVAPTVGGPYGEGSMTTLTIVLCGALGLLIGSFLNVVIARVPIGESIVRPPSHCPTCNTTLRAVDNIPVVSWIALRGKCRTCGTAISRRYPLVELLTAVVFAALGARFGPHADLPAHLVAGAAFVALSFIDIDTKRLPDRLVFPAFLSTYALLLAAALVDNRAGDFGRATIGAAVGFGALLLVHLVRPDGMGFGDVKLAALCGLVLGWQGVADVILGLYFGFVLGALIGGTMLVTKRAERGKTIPFGPFLAAGTLIFVIGLGPLADVARDWF